MAPKHDSDFKARALALLTPVSKAPVEEIVEESAGTGSKDEEQLWDVIVEEEGEGGEPEEKGEQTSQDKVIVKEEPITEEKPADSEVGQKRKRELKDDNE